MLHLVEKIDFSSPERNESPPEVYSIDSMVDAKGNSAAPAGMVSGQLSQLSGDPPADMLISSQAFVSSV
jgi:hypothetical protein